MPLSLIEDHKDVTTGEGKIDHDFPCYIISFFGIRNRLATARQCHTIGFMQ